MKPLTKQTILTPKKGLVGWSSNTNIDDICNRIEGYFFTEEQLKEFIGEVFDKGQNSYCENCFIQENKTTNGQDTIGLNCNKVEVEKQELIKQLLQ